ncbi:MULTISPECIES: response regulator transcription factor [Paenibacillus]|uniref:response regulator transcription factor n=1 Tax=Paenibacillus TaxID=44249 RepID=UPI0022B887EB|nr:response regulator transcription factor [Paenibacillus caseinilyticus]MCZ8522459.1 response regulator transcription factor [Paenibacillus caseinilyticus]
MLKVLLVDDEMFVRMGLRSLIDWEGLGYEVCGEAENGEEAHAEIRRLDPDLVITDIRMPVLDGLGLIRTVTEEQASPPSFVIISGYHDFHYAQKALRYGVQDYLLKPVDDEEMQDTLKKLAGRLSLRRLSRSYVDPPAEGFSAALDLLIHGNVRPEDAFGVSAVLGMEQSSQFTYIMLTVQTDPAGGAEPPAAGSLPRRLAPVVKRRLGGESGELPMVEGQPGVYGLLLDHARLEGSGEPLYRFLSLLHRELSLAACGPVSLYAGRTVERISDVPLSYRTAHEAYAYKFAEDGQPVIAYEHVQGTPLSYFDIDPVLYSQLVDQLEENRLDACLRTLDDMILQFKTKRLAPSAVANSVTRCVIDIVNVIRGMEGDENSLATLQNLMEWQGRESGLSALREHFAAFLTEASACIGRLRKEQAKGGIEKIRKFIESHYMENISLKSIAARFYMNPVYLGQLFRKTYGAYFNDYLLGIRIGEAKRLLRQTDLRMYEVADKVGFQNADYFVTQFEKLEGVTPTEYRNKLIGKA